MKMSSTVLIGLIFVSVSVSASVPLQPAPFIEKPLSYVKLRSSAQSTLYRMNLTQGGPADQTYKEGAPLVLDLHGTRHQIGWDYAALMHTETNEVYMSFISSVFPSSKDQALLAKFTDFLWDRFLSKFTPPRFLEELAGMRAWHTANPRVPLNITTDVASIRFSTLANLPADTVNIISMLEQELEQGWPAWLKDAVNDIIRILEKLVHSCDAYGVWGSRTVGGLLHSSRNLDYNSDTGINKEKLVTFFHINDSTTDGLTAGGVYATQGFAFGLGALAGQSQAGVTVSEMNLDNSNVTFSGVPFPLRLRYVLEESTTLQSAMTVWNATNNTNSFNFLIGSAQDTAAYALETMMGFTAQFPANSPVEAAATYDCGTGSHIDPTCHKWTNSTGAVPIGSPLPDAVWRTNHGMSPVIMKTQEPLFFNTMFRYRLLHDMFTGLEEAGTVIDEGMATRVAATTGIKGTSAGSYFTCDQAFKDSDHVLSVAYAPGPRPSYPHGMFNVAWESGAGDTWRPAACSPYVTIDFADWV